MFQLLTFKKTLFQNFVCILFWLVAGFTYFVSRFWWRCYFYLICAVHFKWEDVFYLY